MLSPHVAASLTYFDPQPAATELPPRMPSPFAPGTPHPLAVRAAEQLRAELPPGLRAELARDGKMLGVLVVDDGNGRIGFLRAFSGMVGRAWDVPGFVGPTFDQPARDGFWIAGEQELIAIADQIAALDAQLAPLRNELAALEADHASALAELKTAQQTDRDARNAARAATTDPATLAQLANASSRANKIFDELRRSQRAERNVLSTRIDGLSSTRTALDAQRAAKSREFLVRIHGTYALANARGEQAPLRALFAPAEPPGGAGDCAAPKLLAHAYRMNLRPIALAEFWCGAPPPTGDRRDGAFYPACRGKCGPILGHMLAGLDAEPRPAFLGDDGIDPAAPFTLFEDAWLAVIAKPAGLLSVPARSSKADSVLARLRARYPDATGPLLPHRLDLDTSGVMLVAKDQATHGALQRQFSERTIRKLYVAILDGEPREDAGIVDLPLRVDLDDRPRQIVDPVHGKSAVTRWQVLRREPGRTRVALRPETGRAHQLRVHAAHPAGIGVPIVGDRLYGRPLLGRLLLHAEAIELAHPHTQERLSFTHPSPF